MFEHLRFYSNGFPLWCNVSIRFCCTMVLLMTTGRSRVHYQTNFVISVISLNLNNNNNNNNNNNIEYICIAQNRKSADALVAADKQVFFSVAQKVCTDQDSIRSYRGKLFHTTAADTANSLVPMAVFVRRSTSVLVLADRRCRLPATYEAS